SPMVTVITKSVTVIECRTLKELVERPPLPRNAGNSHIPGMSEVFFVGLTSRTESPRVDRRYCELARRRGCRMRSAPRPRVAHHRETGQRAHSGSGRHTVAPSSIRAWLKSPGRLGARKRAATGHN